MKIYLCEDSFEGIMTAVYDAWADGQGHADVRLALKGEYNLELFAEYTAVTADTEKTGKVVRTLRQKVSEEVFAWVYKAALSQEREKADWIYRFIVLAIRHGAGIVHQLGDETVMKLFSMVRNVSNESHLLLGFIRFRELGNGMLLARISPKNQVLTLVAPHFENRLSGENWAIYDETHHLAAIHAKNHAWVLSGEAEWNEAFSCPEGKDGYEELWKIFFRTVSIEARENPACQRNMLPIWYRKNMIEFS